MKSTWDYLDLFRRYADTDIAITKRLEEDMNKRFINKNYGIESAYTPQKVFYDEAAGVTMVIWRDNTKTIVRAEKGIDHDAYAGYCAALAKKIHGTNSALKRDLEKVLVVTKTNKEKRGAD